MRTCRLWVAPGDAATLLDCLLEHAGVLAPGLGVLVEGDRDVLVGLVREEAAPAAGAQPPDLVQRHLLRHRHLQRRLEARLD